MKIRTGFVSNSSSSSFVVAFHEVPETIDELKKMLFSDLQKIYYYDIIVSTYEIACRVFNDMDKGKVTNITKMSKIINSGLYPGMPEYNRIDDYKEYNKRCKENSKKLAKKFMETHKGSEFFTFMYSDNNSDLETIMEHGNIFKLLPYIMINNH